MIKKQQKWIAVLVVCAFIWLLQVSTMPVAAADGPERISSAGNEQAPNFIEEDGPSGHKAKKKSPLPFILIGVGLITITAVVLILVVLKSYNIVGDWAFQLTSITYPGDNPAWDMTFYGDKKSGTFMDSDGYSGIYTIDGKNITQIKYDSISITFTGKFDGKDKISGNYTWTFYGEVGTWTGSRIGSSAAMPKSPSQFKEKKDREMLAK
jgi:hypothetical protein